jgi:hypothetical protein
MGVIKAIVAAVLLTVAIIGQFSTKREHETDYNWRFALMIAAVLLVVTH